MMSERLFATRPSRPGDVSPLGLVRVDVHFFEVPPGRGGGPAFRRQAKNAKPVLAGAVIILAETPQDSPLQQPIGMGGRQGQGTLHVGDGSKLIQVLLDDEKLGVGSENLGFHAGPPGKSDGLSLAPASITHFYQGIERAGWKGPEGNP